MRVLRGIRARLISADERDRMKALKIDHKIKERAHAIDNIPDSELPEYLEKLDRDIVRACLMGRKKVERQHVLPWSPALIYAKRRCHYYHLWISALIMDSRYGIKQRTEIEADPNINVNNQNR